MKLRQGTRRLARTVASASVDWTLRRLGVPRSEPARILCYHRVADEEHRSCVRPADFARQMTWLSDEGYRVVPLTAALARLKERQGRPVAGRPLVVLTFDDGFADAYTDALPVLERHRYPATVFVVAGFVGAERLPVLRDHPGTRALAWSELRALGAAGVTVGAHSMTHRELTTLADAPLGDEVTRSRTVLEDGLGTPVEDFCYPRGAYDTRVLGAVRKAGYRSACTTLPGGLCVEVNPLALPRTYVSHDDTLADFARKLRGAYDLLHHLRQGTVARRLGA